MSELRGYELAVATLAAIETHPQHWRQSEWVCETGMCFAGWAASLAGAEHLGYRTCEVRWEGLTQSISEAARLALGLDDIIIDPENNYSLFYGNNSLDFLYEGVALLFGRDVKVVRKDVQESEYMIAPLAHEVLVQANIIKEADNG